MSLCRPGQGTLLRRQHGAPQGQCHAGGTLGAAAGVRAAARARARRAHAERQRLRRVPGGLRARRGADAAQPGVRCSAGAGAAARRAARRAVGGAMGSARPGVGRRADAA